MAIDMKKTIAEAASSLLFEKRVITERLLDALDIYSSEDPN